MDLDDLAVVDLSDGNVSHSDWVVLSDDDDEDERCTRICDSSATPPENIRVNVSPMEVLIQLARDQLESSPVTFTFFHATPKTAATTRINIGVSSMHNATNISVTLSKPTIDLTEGVHSDQCVATFTLKSNSPMRNIGVHIKIAQVADITNFGHRSVKTFQITTNDVDPQCACFEESELSEAVESNPSLLDSHGESIDMIVLFFFAKDGQKVAIACNKKKPFQDLINAYKKQFLLYGDEKSNFRFTNIKTKQTCCADQTPESIGLSHQDKVFVSKCLCKE